MYSISNVCHIRGGFKCVLGFYLINILYSDKIRKTKRKITKKRKKEKRDYIYVIYNALLLLGMIHMNVMCELWFLF